MTLCQVSTPPAPGHRRLKLVARARQFSSFLLLIGKMGSKDEFLPKHAIILQNKDSLEVPLLLEQLPTPQVCMHAPHPCITHHTVILLSACVLLLSIESSYGCAGVSYTVGGG